MVQNTISSYCIRCWRSQNGINRAAVDAVRILDVLKVGNGAGRTGELQFASGLFQGRHRSTDLSCSRVRLVQNGLCAGQGSLQSSPAPRSIALLVHGLHFPDQCAQLVLRDVGGQFLYGIVHKGDSRAGIVLILVQQTDRTVFQLGQAGVHIVCAVVVDHIGVRQAQGLVVVEEEGVNATVLPSSAGGCRYQNSGLAVDWLGVAQD